MIESLLGTLVAVSNIFVITIMIAGRWKLMKVKLPLLAFKKRFLLAE